jgi:hypothetical protein
VIVIVAIVRARDVLLVLPLDPSLARAVAKTPRGGLSCLAERAAETAMGQIAWIVANAEPDDRLVAIEDARDRLRDRLVGRLMWLRVLAPSATALGLAGTAYQASWAQHPPGLLALDPARAMGMAASDGALCLALGFAGSTSALAALFFLRGRALTILAAADRVADVARDAWTSP